LPIIQEGEDFFFLHTSCYKTITKNPFKLWENHIKSKEKN
jgi:hypothetical protein